MATELRKTGISVVGDVPWGTHFCHFYETKQDLLDTLVPYFKAGLESREFCVWVVSDSQLITMEEAKGALKEAVPDLDRHLSNEDIEILNGLDWYLEENVFNLERVTKAWDAKLKQALARGYDGMRVSGDTFWLKEKDWKDFFAYEKQLNDSITDQPMTVLCTYPLAKTGAAEVLDVVHVHQFAIARRQGEWEVIETPELIQAKQEIKILNEELEQRVVERTRELAAANEELRREIAERQRAEDALRRSEDRLRLVIDTVPALIHTGLPDGQLDFFNQRWLDFVGLSLEDLSGWKWTVAIHPDDVAAMVERWRAALVTGEPYEHEARVRRADGEYRWMVHREVPLRDERGNIVKWFASSIDIEDRKRADDALRQSEDHLRLVIDTIPTMAWSLRPDGVVDFVNQRWMDYTGLSLEEESEEPTRPMHPEDIPRAMERWLLEKEVGEPYEDELRLRRADGEYRWFLVRTAPLRDEQGSVVKWYGVSIDIEDLKRADTDLKESQRRLKEAQRIAHVGHWDRDLETGRITWSDEIYRILGLPLEDRDSARTEWLDVAHPEDRQRLSLALEEMQRGIRRFDVEFRIVRPNGEVRFIHSQGDVIRDERSRPLRRFGTAQDITERVSAEEELKKEKEILEKIFENIPVMIGFVGQDGRVKLVNPEWERTIGWTLKELQEQNVDIFVEAYPDPSYRQEVLDFVAASTGEWVDLKIKVRDGRVIDAACAVVHLSDGTKVAIAQDITERKLVEEKLLQSERQLAEAQRLAHVGSWDWDIRSNAVTWSDELYRIFGLQPGKILAGGDARQFIHPEDRDLVSSTVERSVKNKEPYSFYYRILRPDGEERIVHSRGHIMSDEVGNPIRVFGATEDVTELKRAEEKLKATNEQFRALSARLQTAKEEESTRIAREIHDELGGALTALRWDLEEVGGVISEATDSTQLSALRKRIEAMTTLTGTTLDTIRRLASELRPMALDELGLVEAIEWQALQFQTRTGIAVEYECSLEKVDLNSEQSTAVFRILQETLTNVLRHAQATEVTITMRQESGEFFLAIKDNGIGITESEKSGAHSLGLLGMRERAHLINADIEITGIEGKETVVAVRIPVSEPDESRDQM